MATAGDHEHNIRRAHSEPRFSSFYDPLMSPQTDTATPVGDTTRPHDEHRPTIPIDLPTTAPVPPIPTSPGIPEIEQPADPGPLQTPQNRALWTRLLISLGFGRHASQARKSLVTVLWNLAWGFIQITVITVMLVLTGVHYKDQKNSDLSEWVACDKPLGVWGCLWIARVLLASTLAHWEFRRARILHQSPNSQSTRTSQRLHTGNSFTSLGAVSATATPESETQDERNLPNSVLYSRLTLVSTLLTIVWFLSAHVLAYTSISTCRHTSPHLWWLVFGIMCILYLMILEVVVLGFVVLILAPILFIFWNIILICLGRHPMQNPGTIAPDIGKLSKSVVDSIPLRVYIPAPPPGGTDPEKTSTDAYPPKPAMEPKTRVARLSFLRSISSLGSSRKGSKGMVDVEAGNADPSWINRWEKTEYPFVPLEGNRATCAICLMDFEEPKRKVEPKQETEQVKESGLVGTGEAPSASMPANQSISQEERASDLKLSDAGEGAQPLRLLDCSHVFHKSCLDPWLTDVSGRCPICQKAVETKKARKSRRG